MLHRLLTSLGWSWLVWAAVAGAANRPLEIVADQLDMDDRNKTAVFSGHVQATDQEMKLFSDRMTVRYQDDGEAAGVGSVRDVRAEGHVTIRIGDREGQAETAHYKVRENTLELAGGKGKAVIQRGSDRLEGKRILITLSRDRRVEKVSVQGGDGRVSARITSAEGITGPSDRNSRP